VAALNELPLRVMQCDGQGCRRLQAAAYVEHSGTLPRLGNAHVAATRERLSARDPSYGFVGTVPKFIDLIEQPASIR
jgi:hypothetical protein